MMHKCICWSPLLWRTTFDSYKERHQQNSRKRETKNTHLAECIAKLRIHIFDNRGNLTLQIQFTAILEIQTGGINDREKQTIIF